MVHFNCPSCGKKIKADERHVGRQGRCPSCGGGFVVPAPELPPEYAAASGDLPAEPPPVTDWQGLQGVPGAPSIPVAATPTAPRQAIQPTTPWHEPISEPVTARSPEPPPPQQPAKAKTPANPARAPRAILPVAAPAAPSQSNARWQPPAVGDAGSELVAAAEFNSSPAGPTHSSIADDSEWTAAASHHPAETTLPRQAAASKPRKALLIAAASVVVAGASSLAVWKAFLSDDDSRTPSVEKPPMSTVGANPVVAVTPTVAGAAPQVPAIDLPTLPDGRFAPGRIRISANVVEEAAVPNGQFVARSRDSERLAIARQVNGVTVITAHDEPAPTEAPYKRTEGARDEYFGLNNGNVVFSPDAKRLAWIAYLGPQRMCVVVDGKPQSEYLQVSDLTFSPDSRRFAYSATLPDFKRCVVVDGEEGRTYNGIIRYADGVDGSRSFQRSSIQFSPDSKRVAYLAWRQAGTDVRHGEAVDCCFVLDGEEQMYKGSPEYGPAQGAICFSPDSKRVAFLAGLVADKSRARFGNESECAVYVDGKEQKRYSYVSPQSLQFAPDGRLFYVASNAHWGKGAPYFLVEEGKESAAAQWVPPGSLSFSQDGKRLAYTRFEEGGESNYGAPWSGGTTLGAPFLVVDGKRYKDVSATVVFSPDARRAMWVGPAPDAEQPDREWRRRYDRVEHVYVDEKPIATTSRNQFRHHMQFSPDGRHVAWLATGTANQEPQIVLDGISLKYPLKGYFLSLRYIAADTLLASTIADGSFRRVEIKVLPLEEPLPAVAGSAPQAVQGSAAAEALIGKARLLADIGGERAVQTVDRRLPVVYAHYGDKAASLAAFDRLAAAAVARAAKTPAQSPTTMPFVREDPDAFYPDREPGFASSSSLSTPEQRQSSRFELMIMIIRGQIAAGDKAGAARTAEELHQGVMAVENVQLPEKAPYRDLAARGYEIVGLHDKAAQVRPQAPPGRLPALHSNSQQQIRTAIAAGRLDEAEKLLGPPAAGDTALRASTLIQIADARLSAADKPGALRAYRAAIDAMVTGGWMQAELYAEATLGAAEAGDPNAGASALAARSARMGVRTGDPTISMVAKMLNDSGKADLAAGVEAAAGNPVAAAEYLSAAGKTTEAAAMLSQAVSKLPPFDPVRGMHNPSEHHQLDTYRSRVTELCRIAAAQGKAGAAADARRTIADAQTLAGRLKTPYYRATVRVPIVRAAGEAGLAAEAREAARLATQDANEPGPDYQRVEVLLQLCRAQAVGGDIEGAEKTLASLGGPGTSGGARDQQAVMLRLTIGSARLKRGDRAGAAKAFEAFVADAEKLPGASSGGITPSRSTPWGAVAIEYAQAGDLAGAVAALDRQKGAPLSQEDVTIVAQAIAASGDVTGALDFCARLSHSPNFHEYQNAIEGVCRSVLGSAKADALKQLLAHASVQHMRGTSLGDLLVAAANAGEVDAVIRNLRSFRSDLVNRCAQARLDHGDSAGARRIIDRGLELAFAAPESPDRGHGILHMATSIQIMGARDDALAVVRVLIDKEPGADGPTTRPATQPSARYPGGNYGQASFEASAAQFLVANDDIENVVAWMRRLEESPAKTEALQAALGHLLSQMPVTTGADRPIRLIDPIPGAGAIPVSQKRTRLRPSTQNAMPATRPIP